MANRNHMKELVSLVKYFTNGHSREINTNVLWSGDEVVGLSFSIAAI
jgi:hypothetical protein